MRKAALVSFTIIVTCIGSLSTASYGQSRPVVSAGLLCDTADQVMSVITAPDHRAAMTAVILDAGRAACGIGLTAYIPGPHVGEPVEVPEGVAAVQQIVILAISTDGVNLTSINPIPQFTAVLISPKPASVPI